MINKTNEVIKQEKLQNMTEGELRMELNPKLKEAKIEETKKHTSLKIYPAINEDPGENAEKRRLLG